jgi:hypothetical protein
MYCPKCSHQPASDSVRFCPSCGFPLDDVADLLANNGIVAKEETQQPRRSLLKRGAFLGITLMFIGALIIAFLAIPRGPYRSESMAFLTLFWAALMILVSISGPLKWAINKVFSEGDSSAPAPIRGASSLSTALPPVQSVPITGIGQQRANTAKIGQPQSVTEHTTSLLDNE